ncbi:MAG: hypothetical protein QOD51_2233 [Candidatus Eremiobacteraeota bacterium]|jgi:hypothetical protein|nr:hypothetical protein [Candidatus Eremiobacteraeota bacterium]
MGWNDPTELRVMSSGQVYTAPVGTALPTSPLTTLSSATWTGAGLLSEDGVALSYSPTVQEYPAWQVRGPVRREITAVALTAKMAMLQWDESNLPLAFGGGVVDSPSAGIYRYTFPLGSEALNEKVMIIDTIDGSVHQRLVIPRGTVSDNVDTEMKRGAPSLLPITFSALEPTDGSAIAYWLTDDAAAFIAGS